MVFVVPSDVMYRTIPLVGGPVNGKSVIVPCERERATVPTENFRSINIVVSTLASTNGPYRADLVADKHTDPATYYVYAAEPNAFVYVEHPDRY